MNKIKNIIIRAFQKYKEFFSPEHFTSKVKVKFITYLLILFIIIIIGLLFNISYFMLYSCYYASLLFVYTLNIYLGPNKYLNIILSESNIIIKLTIPLIILALVDYNQIVLNLVKFTTIILIHLWFGTALKISGIFVILISSVSSAFILSFNILELCVYRMNPENVTSLPY